MVRSPVLLAVLVLSLFGASAAHAAEFIWLEAEDTTSISVKPNMAGSSHSEFLTRGTWLNISIDADQVEKTVPAEGVLLQYSLSPRKAANYEVWDRIGFEFVRSAFDWRVDDGKWTTVTPDELTTDLMELDFWCEVAWLKLGEAPLAAGTHTLEIRLPITKDDKGKVNRILYASDVLCIHEGAFHPYSKFRPDEDWRTQTDRDAERNVFQLPEARTAARTSVKLNGLWEVCRNDEQMPGEVAEPIKDIPAEPKWTAIPVPGDKNTQRPDLLLCHRLWYRTRINVPQSQAGRSFFVVFPQNNLNTTVMVNGTACGFDKNPFARTQIDVTSATKPGVNELWVGIKDAWYGRTANPKKPLKLRRTFNVPPKFFGDGWQDLAYPIWNHAESGILLAPEFIATGPVYAADVFCKPSVGRREMAAEITLANPGDQAVSGELRWEAVNEKTGTVEKTFAPSPFGLAPNATQTLQLTEPWANPKLWWPDDPNLYVLRTTLVVGGEPVDVADTPFGFREWGWAGHDFKLNGIVWHGWADCFTAGNKDEWLTLYHKYHETMMRFWGTGWQGMPPDDAFTFFDHSGVVVRRTGMLDGEAIGSYPWEQDPDLKAERGTDIKLDLADNWRDQSIAQVKGERNHPSIMIWSLENEFMYISCLNMGWAEKWEPTTTKVAQAVMAVDPTRPVMIDGGGALKDQTLPVHGDHYVVGPPQQYPDLAYETNAAGGGRGRWVWDEKRPRFLGEDFYMTGNHPEVSYFEGESAFAGKPVAGVGLWERILHEGYRWAGYGAWHLWLGQNDTDQSQYLALSPRAVFCREWNWTFESGRKAKRTFGIFNDTRSDDPITFTWALNGAGKRVAGRTQEYAVPPGGNAKFDEELPTPTITGAREEYELVLTLTVKGQEVFRDVKPVSVLKPEPLGSAGLPGLTTRNLLVFDPQGAASAFLKGRNIPFTALANLDALPPEGKVLVIGKDALDPRESTSSRLAAYALGGRRIIILEQKSPLRYQGLPAQMSPASNQGSTAFGEDLDHPALHGLRQKDFFTWGVNTAVYRDAYAKPERGAKSLVQCDDNLRYTALAEAPVVTGLLLLSQLQVASNLESSPVAKQLLLNLLGYAATYRLEFNQVAAALGDNPQVAKTLDAMGLQYAKVDGPLAALDAVKAKVAVVSASPANLKLLADNLAAVKKYTSQGGSLVLCGLTPEGLDSYNRIVGVDHMIRPGKRERILFPPVRDRLMSGLTTGDVVLFSSERIFPWTEGNYVVSDMFTYVVDYDEVASFGSSPFGSYDNITNGFVSADGWPLIINFPINKDNSPYDVPIALQKPQTIAEFTWIGNTFYYPQNRVSLIFDGNQEQRLSWKVQPNAEPQTFAVDPPRPAKTVTLEINEWTALPNTAANIGIDNIYLRAQRPPQFYQSVKQMLNVGGLMHYVRGPGNIVLCNLNFKDTEDVPENVTKKRNILAAILRNLKAPFAGGRTVIAGADLKCTPVDLTKQANQYRNERGWFGDAAHTLKDLPNGLHTFAGVPYSVFEFATSPVFNCVMLGGPGVPNSPPEEVQGIPVNQRADALFFLHTARMDAWRDDKELRENRKFEMLRYVVHYADAQTVNVPIYAELDISDFRQKTPTGIPGAQIAWTKPYEGAETWAVVYSKQWDNPRPDVEITSVDMTYGPDRRGVPALLALTAAVAAQ
jgi:Glycosyl hydrolases family 2/Glycosyl hydrolase 2 galactose-binding domain-like/Glycosyl hydrolases family 2, TIM barrel domain